VRCLVEPGVNYPTLLHRHLGHEHCSVSRLHSYHIVARRGVWSAMLTRLAQGEPSVTTSGCGPGDCSAISLRRVWVHVHVAAMCAAHRLPSSAKHNDLPLVGKSACSLQPMHTTVCGDLTSRQFLLTPHLRAAPRAPGARKAHSHKTINQTIKCPSLAARGLISTNSPEQFFCRLSALCLGVSTAPCRSVHQVPKHGPV
jgi:hypothetical protein